MKKILQKINLPQCCLKRIKKISTTLKILKKSGFKKILPLIYFIFLLLGLVLTFIYAFVHSLVICSSIFGTEFCTPTGIFLILCASLPGYLISGNMLSFISELPWAVSFAVVILASFVFYYLLGLLIDKLKEKKLDPEYTSKIIIVVVFFILLFLVVGLL